MTAVAAETLAERASEAARADTYCALARAFTFPDEDFFQEIVTGEWVHATGEAIDRLPYCLLFAQDRWRPPTDYESFQSEYIRLFEVGGRRGPPCPLHSGHYARDRLQTLQEIVRFYTFFGLRTRTGFMPDHAAVELEFMSSLAAPENGSHNETSRRRAQRDFLARHLNWLPELAALVRAQRPLEFYGSLVTLTERFIQLELRQIEAES
jgi:DMSO reductase family type II enzyme chaperone